jgi:hypothetical protein
VPGTISCPTRKTRGGLPSTTSTALESLPAANTPSAWILAATATCATSTLPNMRAAAAWSGSRSGGGGSGGGAAVGAGVKMRTAQYEPMTTTMAKKSRCIEAAASFFSIPCPEGATMIAQGAAEPLILLH